MTEEDSLKIPN